MRPKDQRRYEPGEYEDFVTRQPTSGVLFVLPDGKTLVIPRLVLTGDPVPGNNCTIRTVRIGDAP